MKSNSLKLAAALITVCFVNLACYNAYQITTDELESLESGNIAPTVQVDTASGPVEVRATTPIEVQAGGENYSVSAFNFILSESQLVAPDYDLLLARDEVQGARVFEFARGKTIALITIGVVAAAGSFAAVSILAGSDRAFGE